MYLQKYKSTTVARNLLLLPLAGCLWWLWAVGLCSAAGQKHRRQAIPVINYNLYH